MNKLLPTICILLFLSCESNNLRENESSYIEKEKCEDKIQVLNLGVFHFVQSNDGSTFYINVHDAEVQKEIIELNRRLARFKPTVILSEYPPDENQIKHEKYIEHLEAEGLLTNFWGELGLVAFEVGKLSGCKRIYGVDDLEYAEYDWRIGSRNQEKIKDATFDKIMQESDNWDRKEEKLSLIERLKMSNTQAYMDFMININMDDLHYVNSEGTFDATDQAARLYHRNLRWFANINKLDLTNDDRIFIMGGSAHTAFLNDMFKRSPKFCLVDVQEYLVQ